MQHDVNAFENGFSNSKRHINIHQIVSVYPHTDGIEAHVS